MWQVWGMGIIVDRQVACGAHGMGIVISSRAWNGWHSIEGHAADAAAGHTAGWEPSPAAHKVQSACGHRTDPACTVFLLHGAFTYLVCPTLLVQRSTTMMSHLLTWTQPLTFWSGRPPSCCSRWGRQLAGWRAGQSPHRP